MTLHPAVVVLPAFTDAEYTGDASEVAPWLDRYEFDSLDVAGIDHPVRHAPDAGLVLAPTGIGKSAAATTVSALAAGDAVALDDATIITVGIAGVAPAAGSLGSVFIADHVVDGDIKLRIGETTRRMQWLVDDYVWELDSDRRDRAVAAASDVELADSDDAQSIRDHYDDDDRSPRVDTGPTVCGDEVYHGTAAAEQVEALCRTYGIDGIATTEMEDAGTATALDRFGLLDQYVSIRAAANFDREPAGGDPEASTSRDVFGLGIENAVRVGHAVVEEFSR